MKTIEEIKARLGEIREMLDNEEKRGDVKFTDLEKEARELKEDLKELEARQRMQEEAKRMQNGGGESRTVETFNATSTGEQRDVSGMKWDEAVETEEYRSAWAKDMMGQKLTEEERSLVERVGEEYREFTHTTENSAILIPKTVSTGIWKRAEDQYPLWSDVRKLRVKGHLSMIKSDGNAVDARWYTEDEKVDTDKLGFGMLDLVGCELAKAIQVTWKLRKMSIQEFEQYIIREIGDRMGAALSKAVYEGKGKPGSGDTFKPEPYGIKTRLAAQADTPQIVAYTAGDLKYTDMTAARGAVHSSYASGVTIYANSTTVWNTLANMVDGVGRPLFIADVINNNGVGRILGRTIKEDATIPDGELLIGNVNAGYLANINEDITMYREEHVRERLTDYMGYAIVDGDVVDEAAFVILQAEATPEV